VLAVLAEKGNNAGRRKHTDGVVAELFTMCCVYVEFHYPSLRECPHADG
jgi:hypothetical protein